LKEFIDLSSSSLPVYLDHVKQITNGHELFDSFQLQKEERGIWKPVRGLFKYHLGKSLKRIFRQLIEEDIEQKRINIPFHIDFIYEQSMIFLYSLFEYYLNDIVEELLTVEKAKDYEKLLQLKDKIRYLNANMSIGLVVPGEIDELRLIRNALIHNNGVVREKEKSKVTTINRRKQSIKNFKRTD
jgi:hypothetical protein